MATTHVFIVDENTFPIHLQYMFAGTGSGPYPIPIQLPTLLMDKNSSNMIADISRIRIGDKILFYLQQSKGNSGRFYGIFKATTELIFDNYAVSRPQNLTKILPFRILIAPDEVYENGIEEWEVLDNYQAITPNGKVAELQWSLIYRKLKGFRGCTMITDYESVRLCNLLRNNNSRLNGHSFKFNAITRKIEQNVQTNNLIYNNIPIVDFTGTIHSKKLAKHAFEAQLQAYITQNIGKGSNTSLDTSVFLNQLYNSIWIGNEVYCGLGMRRIDIMIIIQNNNDIYIYPIELKSIRADATHLEQISKYIKWIELYIIPNLTVNHIYIKPLLITQCEDRRRAKYTAFLNALSAFNITPLNGTTTTISKPRHIKMNISANNIQFT